MKSSATDARMPGSDLRPCRRDPGDGRVVPALPTLLTPRAASIATARDATDTGLRQHPAWPDPVPYALTPRRPSRDFTGFPSNVITGPSLRSSHKIAQRYGGIFAAGRRFLFCFRPAYPKRHREGRLRASLGGASHRTAVNADSHMRTSSRLDPARRAMSTHHARASSARMPRRRDGRLPCSKHAVSILQLWCNLNPCTSIRGLH